MYKSFGLRRRAGLLLVISQIGAVFLLCSTANAAGFADAIARTGGLQGRIMWCDAEANQDYLSTREGVAETVRRCKDAGINTIVVDVKPLSGYTLYKSNIAPRVSARKDSAYPKDYDLLGTMVEEGHKLGLKVHAAINVFSEASQALGDGTAFEHPDWQCINYEAMSPATANEQPDPQFATETRPCLIPVSQSKAEHLAVFVNPANRQVRDYELSIVKEIAKNYDIDGLILDRMRYPNIRADFSDLSRDQFENWLGKKIERWPEDIYRLKGIGDEIERGPYFNKWLEWRSLQIHDFVSEVRSTIKREKPSMTLGVYVGSWYLEYYGVGVNWASSKYAPKYDWATESYNSTGYAGLVDYMCAGCYYPAATAAEALAAGQPEWKSVESAAATSNEVVMDDTFVYASLYVLDYKDKPDAFLRAIQTAMSSSQGVMIFDLVYIRNYDWWDVLKQAFGCPAQAPHDVPGLIDKIHAH
ncbi:MAG: alpha amylase family protein [Armatimonadota bacterium]|nr:alpha amylase family protein [Armatimonadota bacterium]